jgi:hypothetical protein
LKEAVSGLTAAPEASSPSVHPQLTPTEEHSYRDDEIGSEERPCIRFRVLIAPSEVHVVRRDIPSPESSEWRSVHLFRPPANGAWLPRKELKDRRWEGSSGTLTPNPNPIAWNPYAGFEEQIADYARKTEEDAKVRRARKPARRATINGFDETHPPSFTDLALAPIPTKRFDAAAFCRRKLKRLFTSKAHVAEVATVLAWHSKRLSVREIAEEMGQTQGWVRHRLAVVSKIYISMIPVQLAETQQHNRELVQE